MQNFNKLINTAYPVALSRAKITDIPYAKEIAKEMALQLDYKPKRLRELVKTFIPNHQSRYAYLEIRYNSVNDAIRYVNGSTILEISSGFSPRGISKQPSSIFFETDLKEMIHLKESIIKKISPINTDNQHYFEAMNICLENEVQAIGRKVVELSFDQTTLIAEGLLTYFSDEEKQIAFDNIYLFLKEFSPKGAFITPDLSYTLNDEVDFLHKFRKFSELRCHHQNYFESHEQIMDFLSDRGLHGIRLNNEYLVKDLTCLKYGVDKELALKIAPAYSAYVITLKE